LLLKHTVDSNQVVDLKVETTGGDRPTLIYFDAYGRAESIRILLSHAKVDYIDQRIGFSDWPALKKTMPNEQIPVWIEKGI